METELTIEYGKKLKERRIIHEELLCCHSQKARDLYKEAKSRRDAYPGANDMRKQLKRFVYPHMTTQMFEDEHMEDKVSTSLT